LLTCSGMLAHATKNITLSEAIPSPFIMYL
jgi:hypothetical protein